MLPTKPETVVNCKPHLAASAARRECPDIETSSDDYARRFAGAAGEYFLDVQARGFEYLMHGLSSSKVLDVGGGHGQLVASFLRCNCDHTIFGSEDSTHTRIRTRFADAGIEYATGDLLHLPYPDRSFDVVVAVRLVSHIEAWRELLAEFCRVARHSVIIDYPSWRSLNALAPLLFRLKKNIEKNTRLYTSFFPSRLARELRRHGFNVSDSYGQFILPMFVHRAMSGARWLQICERASRDVGLTSLFGSPVLLRADRGPSLPNRTPCR